MKCLHILPMNKLSGAEKMALLICKNMKKYESIVVCGGEDLKNIFEKEGVKSYSLDFSNKNILKIVLGLKKIVNENNIKVLHAHDNNASLIAYLTKKLCRSNIKVISHIHNCYPWLKENKLNKKIDSFFRPKYDYNITCGSIVYNFYKENATYFDEKKTTSLSNAIDSKKIYHNKLNSTDNLFDKYDIPKDKFIIGFIGRLDEQKGIIPFINEISKKKERFRDCKILLIGSGNQDNEVKSLLKKLDMEDLFLLTGYQENIYKFYPLIDVFFLPSLYEGLPMVILEAMAFKKPIISMNVGSIKEVIKDNDTGILIENNSIIDFVNKLEKLKDNKELQIKLGNSAYEYVNKNFDIKNYISKLIQSYEKIV